MHIVRGEYAVKPGLIIGHEDAGVAFAQGLIGLCATAGAKLMGAALVIGVNSDENRLKIVRRRAPNNENNNGQTDDHGGLSQ